MSEIEVEEFSLQPGMSQGTAGSSGLLRLLDWVGGRSEALRLRVGHEGANIIFLGEIRPGSWYRDMKHGGRGDGSKWNDTRPTWRVKAETARTILLELSHRRYRSKFAC